MPKEKGLLESVVEKLAKELADDAIDAKGIVEVVDGPIIGGAISVLDNNFAEKYVPEEIKVAVRPMITTLFIEQDVDKASDMAVVIQQKFLNIPGLEDSVEIEIVLGMLKVVFGLFIKLLKKRNA